MNLAEFSTCSDAQLLKVPKKELVALMRKKQQKDAKSIAELRQQVAERDQRIEALEQENTALREKSKEQAGEVAKLTKQATNRTVNQPSSKQPEFAKDTGTKLKKKRLKRKKRPGAGNQAKPPPDEIRDIPLKSCHQCGDDLTHQPVVRTSERDIEDIPPPPPKTIRVRERYEWKWCEKCKKWVRSCSEAALPRSDIGLHALIMVAYQWVACATSLPRIAAFMNTFFSLRISTAGLSRMMIRLGQWLKPIHDELLEDVKEGAQIYADETGWRVKGKLWWFWVFANKRTAYFWPDKQRAGSVVLKILGPKYAGILITDAWSAYKSIECLKQTCMAHILRKMRKFRDAFPKYYTLFIFYQKLRRLVRDGQVLKEKRADLGEETFHRRLGLLHQRLDTILAWKNPNPILKDMIAIVRRQRDHIFTFVEHDGVDWTNNFAERLIKWLIAKRKMSGGSMSAEGVAAYAILQSIAATCALRNLNFYNYLVHCLVHLIRTGSPLSLRVYEHKQTAPALPAEHESAA